MSEKKPEARYEFWPEFISSKINKAAENKRHGSPPFGQKVVDGELVIDPHEQEIIESIPRHHKSGKSLQQIADWLNKNDYKTKRSRQWRKISVKRVLDRLYAR